MSVLVVGSVAYDVIETPLAKTEKALGGSAVFFSAAAGYLSPVNLVGVVGSDFDLQELDFLRRNYVDLSGLKVEAGETFTWSGRYLDNLMDRETIFTKLGVFESFKPELPDSFLDSEFVFLANIQPTLQYDVVRRVKQPRFVAMDTMNYWITGTPTELKRTLSVVDALLVNDSEVRLLSGERNLFLGAKKIQAMGPRVVIVKKGEHGSILIDRNRYFVCPALPVTNLFDPTGAGDTFAGGFMGYLAQTGSLDHANLRRAVVMGTVMASFCVESFSIDRLKGLTPDDIRRRSSELLQLMQIEGDGKWIG
ncbi:MAG: PfkB family carbohydrate kinase [candidate division KSB1 bacterium]|nr:PfkB family carbohydrate kinase [candidate division KSB1 bacterium]